MPSFRVSIRRAAIVPLADELLAAELGLKKACCLDMQDAFGKIVIRGPGIWTGENWEIVENPPGALLRSLSLSGNRPAREQFRGY